MRSTLAALSIGFVLALAAGCGGDDAGAEAWAGDVCSSVQEWRENLTSLAVDAQVEGLSAESIRTAIDGGVEATQRLRGQLEDLGPPDTEAGDEIEQELDELSDQVIEQVAAAQAEAEALPEDQSVPELLESLTSIAGELQSVVGEVEATFTDIQELEPGSELEDGFENAEAARTSARMAASPPAADPAPRRPGSQLALEIALAVSVAVAFADSSIVVLALPELYVEFETSIPGISWVVTAYNLAVVIAALALLPFVRRVRPAWLALAGLLVFLVSSVVCALADDLGMLIGGRVAQGVGAALLLGASLPLFVAIGDRRKRAVGIWIAAGTLGTAVGPALGGVLTEAFDWRAIFAFQAPLAAAAVVAALDSRARALPPPSPSRSACRSARRSGSSSRTPPSSAPSSWPCSSSSPSGATARSPARQS